MKKLSLFIALILTIALLGGCGKAANVDATKLTDGTSSFQEQTEAYTQTTTEATTVQNEFTLEWKSDEKEYKAESGKVFLDTSVKYFVIVPSHPSAYVDKINAEIEKAAMSILNPDETQYNEFKEAYDEIAANAPDLISNNMHSGIYYEITVTFNDKGLLSYYATNDTYYCGAAHGGMEKIGYTYDLTNERELSYTELLGADFETIRDEAYKRFIAEYGEEYFFEPDGVYKEFENVSWHLSDEGVVFFFQQYQVACYAAGCVEITMPLDAFK